MNKSARLLLLGQINLMAFLVLCSLLNPHFIKSEGGVSNYGVYKLTVIPYTLAFGLVTIFTYQAAKSASKSLKISNKLYLLATMYALLLVSTYPYKHSRTLDNTHVLVAIVLFIAELVISFSLVGKASHNNIIRTAFISLLIGSLVSLLSLGGAFHLLYVGQVITSLSFAVLLVTCVQQLSDGKLNKAK